VNDDMRGAWRTKAVEDFLKQVYLLEQQIAPVPTTLLAEALNIAAPSVTDMIKRLSGAADDKEKKEGKKPEAIPPQLLIYTPYQGVQLTDLGKRIALEMVRHHRLLELYLTQKLGYAWDEVHEEADRLEHHISERLEARIDDALGNPQIDPHGDPIPALDGTISTQTLILLSDMSLSRPCEVSRIIDQTPEVLRYFADLGLVIGVAVTLHERAPLNDTLRIQIGGGDERVTISTQVARKVLVICG